MSRFTFPGFSPRRQADTSTHEVEIGTVTVSGECLVVHMIRRAGLGFEGNFLVAKIFDASEESQIWSFPKGLDCLGMLAHVGDETVIALVEKGKDGRVTEIISLNALLKHEPLDVRRKVDMKRQAAQFLDRDYTLSALEERIFKHDIERWREEARAARTAEHEARQRARMELVQRIVGRGRVTTYTADGGTRFGFPVVGDEWRSLSNGTYAVLLESWDEQGPGAPVEAFQVIKKGGQNPQKGNALPVTWDRPTRTANRTSLPKPINSIIVETREKKVFEVQVFESAEDIRKARAAGLNSGTYVTAEDRRQPDGRYEVMSVRKEGVETIGFLAPLT